MMTTLYKLTDQDGYTRRGFNNETLWSEGVTHEAKGDGVDLCSSDVIHAYSHPLVAVMMNPVHAAIDAPRLWECEGDIVADDAGLKCGVKRLTVIREIDVPEITTEQRVRFAILCAMELNEDRGFVAWAEKWLSGADTSKASALAAKAAAAAAAAAEEEEAAKAAAWAAAAAAKAAAWAEAAAWAAAAAAKAAAKAWVAAWAAAAAAAAAAADSRIDLASIAIKATGIE